MRSIFQTGLGYLLALLIFAVPLAAPPAFGKAKPKDRTEATLGCSAEDGSCPRGSASGHDKRRSQAYKEAVAALGADSTDDPNRGKK